MLATILPHPELLAALASSWHGSKILIADGNYPVAAATNPSAQRVFLNLTPGVVDAPTVLRAVAATIPIEAAMLMATGLMVPRTPPIRSEFRSVLAAAGHDNGEFEQVPRHDYYDRARASDVAAVVATAESAIYANVLLTVGVRM